MILEKYFSNDLSHFLIIKSQWCCLFFSEIHSWLLLLFSSGSIFKNQLVQCMPNATCVVLPLMLVAFPPLAGTFTLSNLGMFGVDRFDAILPPGTVSVLT